MAAEEEGCETEIIRAMDHKVLPCNSCWACMKTGRCAKDDIDWILEQTLLGDAGIIISAPVYHLRACSYLMIIAEKTNHLFSRKEDIFERRRVGAAISVGGSGYDGWTSLGLTSINLFLQHFTTLVDQVQVDHVANIGAALTPDNAEAVERCRRLGKNMARTMRSALRGVEVPGGRPGGRLPGVPLQHPVHREGLPGDHVPHLRGARHRVGGHGREVLRGLERRRRPRARFSGPKEAHHLHWIMEHEWVDEPKQLALPEVQDKIAEFNAWGNYIAAPKKR